MGESERRTKGPLRVSREFETHNTHHKQRIIGAHHGTIAHAISRGTKDEHADDMLANAAHIVACWNAVEAVGGDPETVEELVEWLKGFRGAAENPMRCFYSDLKEHGTGYTFGRADFLDMMKGLRAILDRIDDCDDRCLDHPPRS